MFAKQIEIPIQNDVLHYRAGAMVPITRVGERKYYLGDGYKAGESLSITMFGEGQVQVIVKGLQGTPWQYHKVAYYFHLSDWQKVMTLDITSRS